MIDLYYLECVKKLINEYSTKKLNRNRPLSQSDLDDLQLLNNTMKRIQRVYFNQIDLTNSLNRADSYIVKLFHNTDFDTKSLRTTLTKAVVYADNFANELVSSNFVIMAGSYKVLKKAYAMTYKIQEQINELAQLNTVFFNNSHVAFYSIINELKLPDNMVATLSDTKNDISITNQLNNEIKFRVILDDYLHNQLILTDDYKTLVTYNNYLNLCSQSDSLKDDFLDLAHRYQFGMFDHGFELELLKDTSIDDLAENIVQFNDVLLKLHEFIKV